MSSDGETSNRLTSNSLSDALDQIFSRSTGDDPVGGERAFTADGAAVDERAPTAGGADEPYVLPEIVPATEESPATSPTLPERAVRPAAVPVAGATTEPAPAPAAAPAAPTSARASAPSGTPVTTSWSDHLAAVPSNARNSGLRAPGRRPRVRRVTRVLRHIDPWSTFKVGLLFSLVTYLVALTSGVLLWRVADSTGTLDNVERWFTQFGWETFELQGGEIFRNAWVIGLFGVVGMTGGLVLLATVFNLVSDIIGGIRLTVLEEEVVERTISSTRRYVVRQGPAAAGAASLPAQDWDVDDVDDVDEPATTEPVDRTAEARPQPASARATQDWSVDDD